MKKILSKSTIFLMFFYVFFFMQSSKVRYLMQKHYSTFKECFVQNENLLSRLRQIQIEKPSPVQEAILPAIISHKDIIIKDKTGSGKTLGIIIGLLSKKLPQIASNNSDDSSDQSKFIQRRLLNKKYLSFLLIVPTRFGVV